MSWVAKTRKLYYAPDVSHDKHYLRLASDTRSEIAIPILFGEQLLGVLDLESPVPDAFAPEDRQLLQTLANQVATTIRNVHQYEDLKRTRGLVGARTALAWMGMASSTWRHAIDKHALTIREQAQLLCKDLSQVRMHEQHRQVAERLSMLERLADQILEKPLVPPLSSEESMGSVAVDELVGERARQLWQNDPYKTVALKLALQSGTATVQASSEWLRRAFDIIVDNAVNAVTGCKVQEITISTRLANGGVEILVSDTGPGIPQEIQAKLGLEVIEKPEDAKGLGMGLLIAQTIVQTYRGEIQVESTNPTGTTMVIRLLLEG
jgi:two-component system sensor histidine kinase DctS